MRRPLFRRIAVFGLTHTAALLLGGSVVYFASEPTAIVWGFFLGNEVQSQASFPRHHMARVYSAWGFGEQSLIFVVDGKRVYRTNDFAPGNVNEKIVWDESGRTVTFSALGSKIFTYDSESRIGYVE